MSNWTGKIPAKSFAVAAQAAANCFLADPAHLFERKGHAASRARVTALAAMIQVFPSAHRASIGQGFGVIISQAHIASMICQARKQAWWSDDYVDRIADAVERDLRENGADPYVRFDDKGNIIFDKDCADAFDEEIIVKADYPEKIADRYVRRDYRPARIISPLAARPANVTARVLGDPPPGRREMLARERHPYYSAGAETRGPSKSINANHPGGGEWRRAMKASAYLSAREREGADLSTESA